MRRSYAYPLIAAACIVPRLVVLLHERGSILDDVEKSSVIARVFLDSGTFGYAPGEPTAYTQPLYGWFLIAVYWLAGTSWWSIGTAQILVAVATAWLVYETGRRFLSPRVGLVGALIATLQPYLLWHDVHGNREILDGLLGVSMFFLALLVAERRSVGLAALLGLVAGVAILSNARLFALPLVLGAYLLWRGVGWTAALVVPVLAAVALAPWLVRNQVAVGCLAITTDARALWKANNLETYGTLRAGGWIDNVPDIPERRVSPIPDRWLNAQEAGEIYENHGRRVEVDECAQQSHYQGLVWDFWREHPGEKAKLAAQATWMMWRPNVAAETGPNQSIDRLRTWVQPLYTVPLFVGALVGLFLVSRSFRVLALAFLVYQTAMAWIFAGTTRYRVPWDFVLALLAAVALERAVERVRAGREARVPGGRVDVAYDARR